MTRITFSIEGVERISFSFDNGEAVDDDVDPDAVTALLETALARIEPHRHTPLAEVRPAPLQRPVSKPQRTQGSGAVVHGLEQVPCAACGAAIGEFCVTASGSRYFAGYGHQARISLVAPDRRRHP